jgi:hypothetical protein
MTLRFHPGLLKDLSLMLNDSNDFNVTIKVCKNQKIKEFRAHSAILCARSPYFKRALSADCATKNNNVVVLEMPNITPTIFDMILK